MTDQPNFDRLYTAAQSVMERWNVQSPVEFMVDAVLAQIDTLPTEIERAQARVILMLRLRHDEGE